MDKPLITLAAVRSFREEISTFCVQPLLWKIKNFDLKERWFPRQILRPCRVQ